MNVSGFDYTVDPCLEGFKDEVAEGKIYWQTVEWPSSSSVLNVISGVSTPKEALDSIDEKFDEILNK